MNPTEDCIVVVDDDFRVREALQNLLESEGFAVVTFGTATAYMEHAHMASPSCLVLDVQLPDISGLDLQRRLAGPAHTHPHPHIVFITGHGDIPSSVQACKAGAVDFLTKPFSDVQLLRAVREAVERGRQARRSQAWHRDLAARLATLSPREREVLPLIVSGLMNKQAAAVLGISEITLQIHRRKIMAKMAADSLPDLVRMTDTMGIVPTHSRRARP
ncbi:response regulator transcription factor [Rubrivivax sp. RP6-9]|uniref:response regulator transcription factor n=1 Tax=Rubrivivax sp. RP6-9 TaxID=3415750 RepID=UPI003CC5AB32